MRSRNAHLFLLAACLLCCMLVACDTVTPTGQLVAMRRYQPEPAARYRRTLPYEQQRRFDELYLEAVRQRERGNLDAAADLLSGALELNPDAPEAVFDMGVIQLSTASMLDTTRVHNADSLLRLAVELAPHNKHYKETLARHLLRSNLREAASLYEELAATEPTEENLSMLIRLHEQTGNFPAALTAINRLEELAGSNEDLAIEKFRIYITLKQETSAYRTIEDLCANFPDDLKYRVLLGDLYAQQGHPEQARMVYADVLAAEPDNAYAQISMLAYYHTSHQDSLYEQLVEQVVLNPQAPADAKTEVLRGYIGISAQRGDSARALPLFRRALELPQADRSLAELCAYYIASLQMPEDSLAPVMNKILDVEPDYSQARLQLLQIALDHNDSLEALRLCRDGQAYSPSETVYYYYEAAILTQQGRNAEAVAALRRGQSHLTDNADTELASSLLSLLGDLLHEQGDNEAAYAAYTQALDRNPENALVLNNYAYFLCLDGRELDHAEAMSRKAIEAEPESATYLDTYAWVLFQQRQYAQADIYMQQALNHTDEPDATLLLHAGDIAFRCGRRTEALEHWRQALRKCDDDALRRQLQQKIRLRRP